jgi:hypothetical protein
VTNVTRGEDRHAPIVEYSCEIRLFLAAVVYGETAEVEAHPRIVMMAGRKVENFRLLLEVSTHRWNWRGIVEDGGV